MMIYLKFNYKSTHMNLQNYAGLTIRFLMIEKCPSFRNAFNALAQALAR